MKNPSAHEQASAKIEELHASIEEDENSQGDVTDRGDADQALRDSEERLRLAVEAGRIGTYVYDLVTGEMRRSPELKALWGLKPDDPVVMGEDGLIAGMHPDDRAAALAATKAAEDPRGDGMLRMEYRVVLPDGGIRWLRLHARREYTGSGEDRRPVRSIGATVDITEFKQAEEESRRASQQVTALLENSPLALIEWDSDYRIVRWTDEAEELFGWSAFEVLGKRIDDFRWVYEDDWPILQQLMKDMLASKRVRNVNPNRNYRKDGTVIYCEWYNSVLRDGTGQMTGVLSLVLDVTERKHVEAALKESERKYRELTDSISDLFFALDEDFRCTYWNRASEWLTGIPAVEAVGESLYALFPDMRGTVQETMYQEAMRSKEPRVFTHEFRLGEAEMVLEVIAYPAERGLAVISRDITERSRVEKAVAHNVYLLQRALLPPNPPPIPGYSLACAYIPAHAGEEVGGDFYDIFATEDGKLGILIGDVSGKGIEAAALAATSRSTVRAFAYDTSDPAMALAHANSLLARQQSGTDQFITASLVVLDPATGDMIHSSAGHPPIILHRAAGIPGLLSLDCPPMGLFETVSFENAQSSLGPGDKIVLYTDGITEARRGGEFFDVKGVLAVLAEHGHKPPDALAADILEAAREWAQGVMRDDTAIVIVGRDMDSASDEVSA